MGRSRCRVAVALLVLLVLTGCGGAAPRAVEGPTTTVPDVPSTTVAPATTTPTTMVRATATPTALPSTAPAPTTVAPDPALARVGTAGQALVVSAPRYGSTTATFTAYQRDGGAWRVAFGPWPANLGTRGLAPPEEKREGDGRAPSGVYGFDFFFGVAADPGVRFQYRRVTSRSIVWDDDSASARYNTWVDLDEQAAGKEPEPMYVSPAYDYGAVIAYNTARTPGLGSAIFLHVSNGGPTAGCVSLPADRLVAVLRWLDPAQNPRIALGVAG